MKVKVRSIPPEGLTIEKTSEPAEYDLADKDLGDFSLLKMVIKMERIGNTVSADVSLKATLVLPCARCLELTEHPIDEHFQWNDTVTEMTEYVDLTEDIRQEIILDLPVKILCQEDCKGLCPNCGANLNKEKCQCKQDSSKGSQIKINSKKG